MDRSTVNRIAWGAALAGLLALAACAPKSHEEQVEALRAHYTASLNGFIVKETPLDDAEAAAGGTPATDGEDFEPAPLEVRKDLLLDLLIVHDTDERLPGVTVDVEMADPAGVEKARWRVWVDTAGLAKATHKQVSHEIADVDYEEGDMLYAEVLAHVPEADRPAYREFAESGG